MKFLFYIYILFIFSNDALKLRFKFKISNIFKYTITQEEECTQFYFLSNFDIFSFLLIMMFLLYIFLNFLIIVVIFF